MKPNNRQEGDTLKKKKLTYDDIKLGGKVTLPDGYKHLGHGEITAIDNMSLLSGINEPIFHVRVLKSAMKFNFGLKYILKYYINE